MKQAIKQLKSKEQFKLVQTTHTGELNRAFGHPGSMQGVTFSDTNPYPFPKKKKK